MFYGVSRVFLSAITQRRTGKSMSAVKRPSKVGITRKRAISKKWKGRKSGDVGANKALSEREEGDEE
jgi:hypothetical protein